MDDLIELKQQIDALQRKLTESETQLTIVLKTSHDAVFICQGSAIKFCNESSLDLTGYTSWELQEIPFEKLIHDEDQEKFKTIIQHSDSIAFHQSSEVIRIKTKQHKIRYCDVCFHPITFEGIISVLISAHDVTVKFKGHQRLKQSEESFRLAFQFAKDAIFWADPETGEIINCNPAAERMLKRCREEIIG